MRINKIQLSHFRNHPEQTFEFGQVTGIIGQNGTGKTNLLEAIRFLSICKSFKAGKEAEVIEFDQSISRIVGQADVEGQGVKIEVSLERGRKLIKINHSSIHVQEAVGRLKTVLFTPGDLDFVTGPPSLRRRFIDLILCQSDKKYLRDLLDLAKILRQRNLTLIKLASRPTELDELAIWDEQLLTTSANIQPKRLALVNQISLNLARHYQSIAADNGQLSISYQPSQTDRETITRSRARDLRLGATSHGPHHDDIQLLLNNRALGAYGSRGEQRSAILAIKQAEVEVLSSAGEPPILLVDDIASELDDQRLTRLIKLFTNQQTILSATALSPQLKQACDKIIQLDEKLKNS